jgi:hypothetical protein
MPTEKEAFVIVFWSTVEAMFESLPAPFRRPIHIHPEYGFVVICIDRREKKEVVNRDAGSMALIARSLGISYSSASHR